MEPLGKKLQQARLARKISLEEASRVTKIRASRIQEIEDGRFLEFLQPGLRERVPADLRKIPQCRRHTVSRRLRNFARSERRRLLLFAGDTGQRAVSDRAPSAGETLRASSFYHRGRRVGARFVFGQTTARYPAHHALPFSAGHSWPPRPRCHPQRLPAEIIAPRALPVEGTPASEAHVTIGADAGNARAFAERA